ncbi:MAG: hypothetical protein MUP15_00745, partial [Dehalococcoidia bacterium]|nr:hypothetical protein [Dehalococcoidia bacterium]
MLKALRFFALASLPLFCMFIQIPGKAQTGFSDSFHSTSLDSGLWTAGGEGIGLVDPQIDGLHMTLAPSNNAPAFDVAANSRCILQGDVDAQVEYRLTGWLPANGTRLGLGAVNLMPAWVQRTSETDGQEHYLTIMGDGGKGWTDTTDSAGRLRLTRTGDTLAGYYYSSGSWVLLNSYADPSHMADTYIALQIWAHNSTPGVEVVLENFSVTADGVQCPPPFTPTFSYTFDDDAPDDP